MGVCMNSIYQKDGTPIDIEKLQQSTRQQIVDALVECRVKKKISQKELSELTGIQRSNIARFESGRYNPSLELLVRIAAALDMKLEWTLSDL